MKPAQIEQDGTTLNYRWARVGEGDAPALLLLLHGAGERGDDNEAQLKHGVTDILAWLKKEGKDCVVLVPQCPKDGFWANLEGHYGGTEPLTLRDEPGLPLRLVMEVVAQLQESEKIDPKRLYVTGLSMGGMGTFELISRHPEKFAAAAPICGLADLGTAETFKSLPIWIFHGDEDKTVPVEHSRQIVKALKAAGGEPKYTEYPGVGHGSWTATYKNPEFLKWLFEQSR